MSPRRIAWRREMLLLCLVAMEALCLTAWTNLLVGSAHAPEHRVPVAALLALLLATLAVARALGASRLGLGLQQAVCGGLAIVTGVALGGLFLYREYPFLELDWLLAWAPDLARPEGTPSLVLMGVALYAWWRGIALAQSRLASDTVGRCFQAGIVSWLGFHLLGLYSGANQPTTWLLLYFALGLTAVGLARVEDAQQERGAIRSPFAASWAMILAGLASGVVALGLGATLALSWASRPLFWALLVPLGRLLSHLVAAALNILGLLLAPLMEWFILCLQKMLAPVAESMASMPTLAPTPTPEPPVELAPPSTGLQAVLWALAILAFLAVVALVARLLQRRRAQHEPEVALDVAWGSAPPEPGAGLGGVLGHLRDRLATVLGTLRPGSYSLATVRQLYASLQKLAAWRGVPRADAQTPYEYEQQLDGAWPDAAPEVQAITDAYVRAHYGRRSIAPEELEALRTAWQRLRDAIEDDTAQT